MHDRGEGASLVAEGAATTSRGGLTLRLKSAFSRPDIMS